VFSGTTVQNALTAGLLRSIAARCAWATSTGESFLVRMRRTSSTAERRVRSLGMRMYASYTLRGDLAAIAAGQPGRKDMNQVSQYALLKQRRFLPLFVTQFLGAFNDNVYKNALVILVAFHAASLSSLSAGTLSNLAQALFILPFFLFSATAGQIADKVEKSFLIRLVKLAEIAIMALGATGLLL